MQTLQLRQVNPGSLRPQYREVEDAVVITESNTAIQVNDLTPRKPFIEANTKEVTFHHLKHDCITPVFSKDNEVTISHFDFIETVYEAASKVFPRERIDNPEIRVSHIIKGRTPEAIHKSVDELLDEDKTLYYERASFVIEIPTIHEDINGNQLTLSVGGVRAYNHENLYSKKIHEKFKVFIGFKNLVCCNMCVSTDGYQDELKALNCSELMQKVIQMFQRYNVSKHLLMMNSFKNHNLTEHQFAQLLGKSRLYQCLPPKEQKLLPKFEFNDGQLNMIARNYYKDDAFCKNLDNTINLWNVYNLFTSANKNSYIDNFLDKAQNATDFLFGISEAISGKDKYKWFIE